jgi:hypothetical protein
VIMKKETILEYGSLDAHTLYVVYKWVDKYKHLGTIKKRLSKAICVSDYLMEQHHEER